MTPLDMDSAVNPSRHVLFEQWACSYDDSLREDDFPFAGYERVLDTIVARAMLTPASTVLDLGTGTANLAARLVEQTPHVVGVDFSEAMLAQARQKLPTGTFLPLDLLADEWPTLAGRRFDRIVAAYVLHEFPLPRVTAILRRLCDEHLNAGGAIVFGDIAFPTTERREQARQHWHDSWDDDEYYWAADEATEAFAAAGLQTRYEQLSPCAGCFVVTT